MRLFITIFLLSIFIDPATAQEQKWHSSARCDFPYTFEAYEDKIEGTCHVAFAINEEGYVIKDSIRIIKKIGYGLDSFVINTINNMPRWQAKTNNSKFPISIVQPIKFTLDNVSECFLSDYYLYKGNQHLNRNEFEEAFTFYKKSYKTDNTNMKALKELCLIRFALGRDVEMAKSSWEKLYKKGHIPEEEYINRISKE